MLSDVDQQLRLQKLNKKFTVKYKQATMSMWYINRIYIWRCTFFSMLWIQIQTCDESENFYEQNLDKKLEKDFL
jgi:hypothetical protein